MPSESFEVVGPITGIETIATGHGIAEAGIHWYEAHGIGKRWMKIKRYLD